MRRRDCFAPVAVTGVPAILSRAWRAWATKPRRPASVLKDEWLGENALEQTTKLGYGIAMPLNSRSPQASFPGFCPIEAAAATMAESGIEARGAVFTRREVVDFILDLAGYTSDKPLHQAKLLEPSMGQGGFLTPVVERLLAAYSQVPARARHGVVDDLGDCITAVELHQTSYDKTCELVRQALRDHGLDARDTKALCQRWLRQGDFLLMPLEQSFTHAIGNPPYVRQELIPDVLMTEYRRRFSTIYDRADIYVPFIERSLSLLAPGGQLGFICADRWMKNRYGGPLRRLIAEKFHLRYFVDMVDTNAFHSDVIAYPAIVVISREKQKATRIAFRPAINASELQGLSRAMLTPKLGKDKGVSEIATVARGTEPWMLEAPDQLALIRRLEAEHPTLKDADCRVGIGVATGADQVFIGLYDELDVEPDRKLPLAMTRDIATGVVQWRGLGVINPFADGGGLVPLRSYPKLAAYSSGTGPKSSPAMCRSGIQGAGIAQSTASIRNSLPCRSCSFQISRAVRRSFMSPASSIRITTCISSLQVSGICRRFRRCCCRM